MDIEILQGVKVEIKGDEIIATGSLGSNKRKYNDRLLLLKLNGNRIEIDPTKEKKLASKAEMAVNALAKEIQSDMEGTTKYFEKHMSVVFAHFPLTVEAKGSEIIIKNMIGERAPRKTTTVGSTKVEVKGQNLRVYGTKLEDVSQTAANIRKLSKIRKKDERVFQDGVYYSIQ